MGVRQVQPAMISSPGTGLPALPAAIGVGGTHAESDGTAATRRSRLSSLWSGSEMPIQPSSAYTPNARGHRQHEQDDQQEPAPPSPRPVPSA